MPITLQQVNLPEDDEGACFTVQSTVVRCDDDGVGFSILLDEEDSNAAYGNPLQVRWIAGDAAIAEPPQGTATIEAG